MAREKKGPDFINITAMIVTVIGIAALILIIMRIFGVI